MENPEKKYEEAIEGSDARKYQRYALNYSGDMAPQVEVIVEKEVVHLVNFSIGGLYFLSKKPFSPGVSINFSADFGKRGKIDLTGTVVRVKEEGDMWGIALDFSKAYTMNTLRKI